MRVKKGRCILLVTLMVMMVTPVAQAAPEQLVMQAEKSQTLYDWAEGEALIACNKDTLTPIPLSEYDNGYFYALVPEGTQVVFEQRDPVQFSDLGEYGAPAGVDYLSRRGVICGDENGDFRGEAYISRAETAALLARILRVEDKAEPVFADVAADSWFAGSVSALTKRGIIAQDRLFAPDRRVTREELMAMSARLLSGLGILAEEPQQEEISSHFVDFDQVSDYAKPAYLALEQNQYQLLFDYDADRSPTDLSETGKILDPKRPVTRAEAAQFLSTMMRDFMMDLRPAIGKEEALQLGLDEQMPKIDGSTSSYPLTQSLFQALFYNSWNHPDFPSSHSKTITSYEKLIAGEVDMIFVPDPNEEVQALAAERGVELTYIPIANEALVFFTGQQNPAEGLTKDQIKKIYLNNAVSDWSQLGAPQAGFAAFCRNNDSGSHAQMERFFLDGAEIHEDIRRERTSIAMSNIITDLIDYEQEHPESYALGYSMYYYIENTKAVMGDYPIKLLKVDGVVPTEQTIADGQYPLSTHYFAVLRSDAPPDAPERKLAQWLTGPQGQELVKNAGFGPLN